LGGCFLIMERLERIFILHRMLSGRRVPVPRQQIEQALECSRATVTRTIATMRDWLGAPIVYDAEQNGYRYDDRPEAANWELPGLWFTSSELQMLLLISEILNEVSGELLTQDMAPLKARLASMLHSRQADPHILKSELLPEELVARLERMRALYAGEKP